MEIGSVGSSGASMMAHASGASEAQVRMAKKVMEDEGKVAVSLIQGATQVRPPAAGSSGHTLNVYA